MKWEGGRRARWRCGGWKISCGQEQWGCEIFVCASGGANWKESLSYQKTKEF